MIMTGGGTGPRRHSRHIDFASYIFLFLLHVNRQGRGGSREETATWLEHPRVETRRAERSRCGTATAGRRYAGQFRVRQFRVRQFRVRQFRFGQDCVAQGWGAR
jgi:hypothetical protein